VVTVERLGHRGDGVATGQAGDIYIPFSLPGERVQPGPPVVVEAASPHRISPVCPHFGPCGGCALQHADDGFLAVWKADLVRQALAARGLEAPIRPTMTSPPGSRRRVVLSGRRTKRGTLVGFHGRAEASLVPVESCAVVDARIEAALPLCARLTGLLGSRRGEVRLALTVSAAGLDIDVTGQKPLDGSLRAELAGLAAEADLARLTHAGEPVAVRRTPVQPMGRAQVVPPPGGFLQATPQGEAALVAAVMEALQGAQVVADLFSGCGTFALPLAAEASVHAVEAEAAALSALDAAARAAPGLRAVTTERRDLFRRPLLAAELRRFDGAVFDPPRAGAAAQAGALADAPLRRLCAVSCNPATFARDARLLVDGGWQLDWVQPVDQFRWSPHVELAAAFSRP
jgi:23S rRNA (uracil1939-C5)-methyltransferase